MGCTTFKENIQAKMINLKLERYLIWEERKKKLKELQLLTGLKFKRNKIPDYIAKESNENKNDNKLNENDKNDILNIDKKVDNNNIKEKKLSKNSTQKMNIKKENEINEELENLLITSKIIKHSINDEEDKNNDNEIQISELSINNNNNIESNEENKNNNNIINYKHLVSEDEFDDYDYIDLNDYYNYINKNEKINSKNLYKNKKYSSSNNIFVNNKNSMFFEEQKNNNSLLNFNVNKKYDNNSHIINNEKINKNSIKTIKIKSFKSVNFPIIYKNNNFI